MGSVFAVKDNELGPVASGTPFFELYPIGSIITTVTTAPYGWHECDGSEYDTTAYPDLYRLLQSDKLPDLREATAVGAGQNTTDTIATHDTFSLLEFKDDSFKSHNHYLTNGYRYQHADSSSTGSAGSNAAGTRSWNYNRPTSGTYSASNEVGGVTIGKSIGVRYIVRMI